MSVDRETVAVYDAKAAEYDDLFFAGQAGAHLKRFMGMVREGGHILDLGCGPGNAARIMQDAGFRLTCTDASAEMVRKAHARGLDARVETFDDISGTALYDGVWANFSLLHAAPDALPRHIADLAEAMTDGAAFHIGMKTGEGRARDVIGRLYTYVTDNELTAMLNDVGITVETRHAFSEVGMAGTEDPCLILQGYKHG